MTRGGAEHQTHHGHEARQVGEPLQVVRATPGVFVRKPMAGALEHEHEWHALLRGELCEAIPLVGAAVADRAAQHGEVLDARERRAPVDEPETGDEAVGRCRRVTGLGQAACESADLDETACIEQRFRTLARIELPGVVLTLHALDAAHAAGEGATALEFRENSLPAPWIRCHRGVSRVVSWPCRSFQWMGRQTWTIPIVASYARVGPCYTSPSATIARATSTKLAMLAPIT